VVGDAELTAPGVAAATPLTPLPATILHTLAGEGKYNNYLINNSIY
jgi:hypothetical protein